MKKFRVAAAQLNVQFFCIRKGVMGSGGRSYNSFVLGCSFGGGGYLFVTSSLKVAILL